MGMDELLKNISVVESEINVQYSQLGKKLYEEKPDSAMSLFPELTGSINANRDKISEFKQQINLIKGIVICEHCGAEVKNTNTFCQECGHKIKSASPAPDGFVLCGNCNTANEKGAKFCKCCGSKLEGTDASSSITKQAKDVKATLNTPQKAPSGNTQPQQAASVQPPQQAAVSKATAPAKTSASLDESQTAAAKQAQTNTSLKSQAAPIAQPAYNASAASAGKEPASDETSGRKCPQCGEPLNEDDTFCISCGAVFRIPNMDDDDFDDFNDEPLVEEAPIEAAGHDDATDESEDTSAMKECPKCGEKLLASDTFCRRCGAKFLI